MSPEMLSSLVPELCFEPCSLKAASRCGLGQTSFNPVLTSLASFRPLYDSLVQEDPQKFRRSFDLGVATAEAKRIRAGDGNG